MTSLLGPLELNLAIPALVLVLTGIILLLLAIRHILHWRLLRAGIHCTLSAALLAAGSGLFLVGVNLYTYHRLTYESVIATIEFYQTGRQRYLAAITLSSDPQRSFILRGDEWQIDARVLKWKPPVNLLGLDSRYRVERISGRYSDIREEQHAARTVFPLSQDKGLDVWAVLGRLQAHVDWVDTYYGSAAYMPMADQARYQVVLTQSGLIVRPLNDYARQSVSGWK